jgi:hypothetical protein
MMACGVREAWPRAADEFLDLPLDGWVQRPPSGHPYFDETMGLDSTAMLSVLLGRAFLSLKPFASRRRRSS